MLKNPDFLIIPYQLLVDKNLAPADRIVYGVIYWMERLKDGRCTASNPTIGEVAGISAGATRNSISKLSKFGYIRCIYADELKKDRTMILTTVSFNNDVVSSFHDTGVSSFDDQNKKSIEKEKVISKDITANAMFEVEKELSRLVKKTSYGNGQVNALIKVFESVNELELTDKVKNRWAAYRLIKKYGLESCVETVKFVASIQNEPYSPKVYSLIDLERKRNNIAGFIKRKELELPKVVKI